MIAIIDYGAGNLGSVRNALLELGHTPVITGQPEEILKADAVILPGVGAAASVMDMIKFKKLDDTIHELVVKKRPLFAVCVGLQVLLTTTEENGTHNCLNIIPGTVTRLPEELKTPHRGWNQVKQEIKHRVFAGIPDETNFYFVNSYFARPDDSTVVAGTTEYGRRFCSMIIKDNLFATQFHPEKSGELGLKMYANFLELAL
jgi:glutamine amidotransferase